MSDKQQPPEKKQESSAKGKRLLIVEDERPLAHALELKFRHEGYDVTVAADGEEALKTAKTARFDLILLDLIMPNMDGFTFMEELAKKGMKTKVIILSNLGQDEDKQRAESLGAIGYYVKSNTPITEIVNCVKKTLS